MTQPEPIPTEELAEALEDLRAGIPPGGQLGEKFIRDFPTFDARGEKRLAEFARTQLEAIVPHLGSNEDTLRHMAAFALGFSEDPRAVEPLLDLLTNQRDHFDHDYCYVSFGKLGEIALEPLFEIARQATGERCEQAVQAIGHSRANALPWLSRLAASGVVPDGFFSAVYNTHEPAALPLIEFGLTLPDAKLRNDALFTSYCLLELAAEQTHPVLDQLDREAWGDRMVTLFHDPQIEDRSVALNAIGYLRDSRHVPLLRKALADPNLEDSAREALDCFGSDA